MKYFALVVWKPPYADCPIERWHQTTKNRILLENYYLPGDLEARIKDFVTHYNHQRYHESLGNLTPADVYLGSLNVRSVLPVAASKEVSGSLMPRVAKTRSPTATRRRGRLAGPLLSG